MRITMLGAGYVGLTTGAALAYLGHDVCCLDKDEGKIDRLKQGQPPLYEPHLQELLQLSGAHLRFTSDYAAAIPEAEIVFIAVGTPPRADGSPDLRFVRAAAEEVGQNLGKDYTVVVNKSTVPIGSGKWVRMVIQAAYFERHGRDAEGLVGVGSNPEFLRESCAVHDTLYPDRIVIGAADPRVLERLIALYQPLIDQSFEPPPFLPRPEGIAPVPLVTTDPASAELIKYAANAFLALKISYINEIGNLASRVGANVQTVAQGIGMDKRIGPRFLQAGLGWGGSCFGKDTSAILTTAFEHGISMPIVRAAREVNRQMRVQVLEKLLSVHGALEGKKISLLGLSFKPETDDLRDAPVIEIIRRLLDHGARVSAHDPKAAEAFRLQQPDMAEVELAAGPEALFEGADAIVLVTEWKQYLGLDWAGLRSRMRAPVLVDGRNALNRVEMEAAGYRYLRIP
jgi:UDPglucose 6-dehydrogenase